MSTDQGDQKEEVGKGESEITSTTFDNDGASVSEIQNIEAVAADADSTVPVVSKESEAVNDEVTDSAIDSLTTDSTDRGTSLIESEVAHGKTTPAIENIPLHPESFNVGSEPCSSKTSDKDSCSISEELELKWDEDDVDESISNDKIDQDIENNESNKSTVDETAELIQKLDSVIDESNNVDKDLFVKESAFDETTHLIQKLDSIINESKNVDVNRDLENESNKSIVDSETAQLIQKLDSGIDESKRNVYKDLLEKESINVGINELLETESNQSDQINEDNSSDIDNIVQKDKALSSQDDSDKKITSSNDNKIDDIEMTSTSFESQNIIDEIDNITEEADINKDECRKVPPNIENTILPDELSKNYPAEDVKPDLLKEEKMDIEIISESPLKSIEEVSNENKNKCKAAENETAVLKDQDTKVPLVETDKNVPKEIINTDTKDENKDLELKKSTNQNEDIKEIDEPNVNSSEVSSVIDSKTDSNDRMNDEDPETINKPFEANTETNKNDSEMTDSKSIPIEESKCDTKSNEIEEKNTETNKSSEKIDSSLIVKSEYDTKSNAIDSFTDDSNKNENKNDSEMPDSKSIPMEESKCDTKSNEIEENNTKTNKSSEKIDSCPIVKSEYDTKSNAIDSITDSSNKNDSEMPDSKSIPIKESKCDTKSNEIEENNTKTNESSEKIDSCPIVKSEYDTKSNAIDSITDSSNKNDSEMPDSKSIPIKESKCDTKSKEIEENNTETNKSSEKIDSSPIVKSEYDTKSNATDSITDDSKLGLITPNIHHRINKPNVMLDIPTQELSDIEAELDDYDDNVKTIDDKNVTLTNTDFEIKELPDTALINEVSVTIPIIKIETISSKLNNTVSSNSEDLQSTEVTSKTEGTSTSKEPIINQGDASKELIDDNNITSTQDSEIVKETESKNTVKEVNVEDKTKIQINEQPSTSKTEAVLEITDDDDQEVSDSLGLLAESSRVMDDNDDDDGDDAEDHEVDDNDDEDFDPYDETNSEMAEDMDDSNTPPPELDPKLIKPGDKLRRESDEDAHETTMDIVDDIECDEIDLDLEIPDETASEIQSDDVAIGMEQPEIIDADMHKDEEKTSPPDKIITILEKVLGSQIATGYKAKDSSGKGNVRNYVEVEGSSDSDDVQEVSKTKRLEFACPKEMTGSFSPLAAPKTQTKIPKINTDEVSIRTVSASSIPPLNIPETTIDSKLSTKRDEIFNLDSDDDETVKKDDKEKTTPKKPVTENIEAPKVESPKTDKKCINPTCTSETQTYYVADRSTTAYYSLTKRRAVVCDPCRRRANERSEALINGIKDLRPLLDLDMDAPSQRLVEISDSDSDGEGRKQTDFIGEKGARFLEEHLADIINETWNRYEMGSRLKSTETSLLNHLDKLEAGVKEIDAMLDECQKNTDAIRFDFYKDFERKKKNVGAIVIHDTPFSSYSHVEKDVDQETLVNRYPKRRSASIASDTPAKRPAIPLGYTPSDTPAKRPAIPLGYSPIDTPAKRPAIPLGYAPLNADKTSDPGESKADDDKEDISVVKLSAESAPADLPPPGEIVRPPLKAGMTIYAMRNAFGTWLKGKIVDVQPKTAGQQFSQCRVKFEHKVKNACKVLAGRCLAYSEPSAVRMTIGTRVVALFKDPQNPTRGDSFYSGVIAEVPNPVNSYRYLVFFDDGYAQYVQHRDTRIVCESSNLVWEEVHQFIREFIYKYLLSYPERPMVRLHAGEKLKTEWNGKWWDSKVLKVDASIALISFDEDNRTEWIYRGSTRLAPLYLELQAARAGEGKGRSRLPRNKALIRTNMPCVEYTRSDEQAAPKAAETQQNEEMRRQRAVAKKSTAQSIIPPTVTPGTNYEGVISRVVYYTPKNAVKPYKMTTHNCTAHCKRTDLLSMKELRTYNPLAKPLLSGWERQTVRYKGQRDVVYRAPCGRRLRNMLELHKYLRMTHSDMAVDLFDFTPGTHCLAEFVLSKCNVSKKDLSHGKEYVPVPCVNYYDNSLPEFCSYNTERTPTAGVPLNLDPEFLCGCDCTDDCMDKTKCACWKMTLEGARTIGLEGPNIGYEYRRLPEPLPSGIYECNSRCKCKQTCLNRVAQHPLQMKLQVFKTVNRGWGIRALNDVPKGSFLCVYAGNLLTDATANLDGLNEGDEYLAELDYIEVVEAMKEGYEDDIPEEDKELDKKGTSSSDSEPTSESEEEQEHTKEDDDFEPGYIAHTDLQFKKSLRKREKAKKKEEEKQKEESNKEKKDDCITISDDEEVREPSRFTAEAGMVDKDLITKHSSRVSVRTLFGKDEACYIMDAKVQGNIGRYLNHSCLPNVFVQNVFVDTHDPRFPWVAFFALSHVRAGTELTWNYNYDVGSVPEKVLYCYCGAANCRGRLL